MTTHRVTVENRSALASGDARAVALDCLLAGVDAAHPDRIVADALSVEAGRLTVTTVGGERRTYDLDAYDEVVILGGGNAAGHVAAALESLLGDTIDGGAVVTDDPVETDRVEVLPGDHPTPSRRGVDSTRRIVDLAERAGPDDLVLGCLTGGGSSLLAAPAGDLSLEDLRATTEALLASGAAIDEINAVRKHLSAIKGGRLARAAAPATVAGLAVSDVTGDDPAVIASGPFAPDPTSYADAVAVLARYDIEAPPAVRDRLRAGARGDRSETPMGADPTFDRCRFHVVANATTALDAARDVARDHGYTPLVLSSRVEGEASEAAKTHAAIANEIEATGTPLEPPAAILSGGETTVTVESGGSGGPNQEFALSAGLSIEGSTIVGAVDSDGIDGASDAAGALVDGSVIDRDAQAALDANDSGTYLSERDCVIVTGQTGTNVNDIRVLVVPELA